MIQGDDNVMTLGQEDDRVSPSTHDNALVTLCRNTLKRHLLQLVQDFFDQVDDVLFEMSEKADSNQSQTLYFDAMREVRMKRESVEVSFDTGVFDRFDRFWRADYSWVASSEQHAPTSGDELSLVNESDLEQSLAVTNMIAKGENQFQGELYALEQRLADMGKGLNVDELTNPLAPNALCHAFEDAANLMTIDDEVRLVVYKLFDTVLLSALGGVYDDVNQLLALSGVLPHIAAKTHKVGSSGSAAAGIGASAGAVVDDGGDVSPEVAAAMAAQRGQVGQVDPNLFATMQGLLSSNRGPVGPVPTVPQVSYPVGDVLSALSQMQHAMPASAAGHADPMTIDQLRSGLSTQIQGVYRGSETAVVSQVEEDTIDVVGMLFEFILDDRNLSDRLKALISRLQIPVLKVAITDKTFFGLKNHPARRLLNELAQAGLGVADTEEQSAAMFDEIEHIVDRVLNEFQDDSSIFGQMVDELHDLLSKDVRQSDVAESRTCKVLEGKEQLELSRRQVASEISRRTKDKNLPSAVTRILDEAWKDVMLLAHLRQGVNSLEWADSVKVIDVLIWSVDPLVGATDRERLLKTIPGLLKSMREGLDNISFEPHRLEVLFQALQECHLSSMKGESPEVHEGRAEFIDSADAIEPISTDAVDVDETPSITISESLLEGSGEVDSGSEASVYDGLSNSPDFPLDQLVDDDEEIVLVSAPGFDDAESEDEADEFDQLVKDVEVGTWVEFIEEADPALRAKLAWKSEASGNCVFVNRKGAKVEELTFQGLAAEFRRGSIRMLNTVPLMDRALDAMMNALQRSADGDDEPTDGVDEDAIE
ncbi:MAG TPA: DUF1631 domain-containing protein [Chromatiaceae bacterium]|nr:DUF1631 domain-containing protein [Chromatiaceae bacterium]